MHSGLDSVSIFAVDSLRVLAGRQSRQSR